MMRSNNAGVSRNEALYTALRTIFAAPGLVGGWYDAYLPTLWDTSTGVEQVDAAEDPVGLWADRRLGMALGPELVDTINTAAVWTAYGTNTVEQDGDAIKVTYSNDAQGAFAYLSAAGGLSSNVEVNKSYRIIYDIKVNSGSCQAAAVNASVNANTAVTSTSYITQQFTFLASNASTNYIKFATLSAGEIVWIRNISVKLLDGNHLSQATAPARPTYRVDANGRPYIALLGTDDNVTSPTGGGGSAGFFFCAAIRPTGGAGTVRNIFDDKGANTGYTVRINTSNNLVISAGNGVAFTTKASTASVSVGTDYVITVFDDGTNLSVQINNGTIETVARPVVVAGSAGFTIGKANTDAADYLIADVYHMCYAKDTGLTASQRETEKRNAASKIGLVL